MADGTNETAGATSTPATTSAPAGDAAPASKTPASTVVEPKGDGQPSLADIMGFDPFAPGKDGKMTVTEVKPEPKPGDVKPEPKPGETQPEVKAEPTVTPAPAKTLEQLIAEQTATIQASLKAPAPVAEPAKAVEPDKPYFNLGVPEQLVNGLASDDPKERATSLNAVVSGVANHVWQHAQELVRSNVEQIVRALPQIIAAHTTQSQEQQKVSTDFFGKYEMFKGEAFGPLLQHAASEVAQEWQQAKKTIVWNDAFRDDVANRMFARFPMLKPAAAPAAEPAKKVPFSTGGGSRQPASTQNEFEQVLSST